MRNLINNTAELQKETNWKGIVNYPKTINLRRIITIVEEFMNARVLKFVLLYYIKPTIIKFIL